MPPIGQVHIDTALTNVSVMYRNPFYLADRVLPILPVVKRSDKYFIYKKEDFLPPALKDAQSRPLSLRAPGAVAAEIDFSMSNTNYQCEEYAYRGIVTDAEAAYADSPLQPYVDQTIQITERLLIDNEVAVANLVGTRANYNSANKVALTTGGTGTSWAQYASTNSLPFNDIKNGKLAVIKGVLREANRMLINVSAARTLADHPNVKDLVKYTHPESLTMSGLPKIVRGLEVLEASQQVNSAAEGASYSGGNLWVADDGSDMALIYYATDAPGLRTVSFGFTFEAPDDTTGARGIAIRRWREDARKGEMVEGAFNRTWKLIAVDGSNLSIGGYLITSATA